MWAGIRAIGKGQTEGAADLAHFGMDCGAMAGMEMKLAGKAGMRKWKDAIMESSGKDL